MPIGAIIAGGGALLGGILQSSAIGDASSASAKAAQQSTALQGLEYSDIANKLLPFLNTGTTASDTLAGNYFGVNQNGNFNPNAPFLQPISSTIGGPPSPTGALAPPNPNDPTLAAQFQQSPGYNYVLQQTMDAIQNSAAGKTGAVSGNMLKALQTNGAGLASQDYNNWYTNLVNSWSNLWNANNTNYNTRYQDIANNRNQIVGVLQNLASGGQSAATNQGSFGQQAVTNIGNQLGTGAAAQGAGAIGQANTYAGLLNNPALLSGVNSGVNYLLGGATDASNPYYLGSYYSGGSYGPNYGGG